MTSLRVLHVDGDASYLRTVAEQLESADGGLDVVSEREASAALERIATDEVDCLLTEASPPGSEPLAFVERVVETVPDLPVVVVDEGLDQGTAAQAVTAGATEFMVKTSDPGALHVLANRVRNVVGDAADRRGGRELVDAAPVGVWLLRGGTVAYANHACAELLGRNRDDLVGRSVRDLVVEADHATLDAHVETLLAGDRTERTDVVTGVGRWGDRPELELRGRQLVTDEGPAVLGTVTDVTAARRTERRLETLFGELDDPVARVAFEDGRAVVRRANPAFESAFGLDADEVTGEPLDEQIVLKDEAAHERALDVYVRAERGATVVEEVRRRTTDGERTFRLQALPFEDGGDPHAYLVYGAVGGGGAGAENVAELGSLARELLAADDVEEMARIGVDVAERVLEDGVACLFAADEAGDALVPLAAGDEAEELFGEVPAVPEGEGTAWYVHEMGEPLVTDDVRTTDTVANPETEVRGEMLFPVSDRGVLVVSSTGVGAFDDRDAALGRTLASTLEAAFDRAEKDRLLRERERELVRENERLEEFAGVVSHDLRSPLAVVKGNASLLREQGDVEYLDRIEAAADRMDALVDDLLSLARQGATVDEPEYVDLLGVVEDAWATADTPSATLSADLDISVKADPSRLQQLLENLFGNAAEHGGDDVTIRVGTLDGDPGERVGDEYRRAIEGFFVEDDGNGLPDEVDDLFDPGTTTDEDGTGFGLAIVRRIAEAHGWEVTATEGAAGGARFEFTGVEAA